MQLSRFLWPCFGGSLFPLHLSFAHFSFLALPFSFLCFNAIIRRIPGVICNLLSSELPLPRPGAQSPLGSFFSLFLSLFLLLLPLPILTASPPEKSRQKFFPSTFYLFTNEFNESYMDTHRLMLLRLPEPAAWNHHSRGKAWRKRGWNQVGRIIII